MSNILIFIILLNTYLQIYNFVVKYIMCKNDLKYLTLKGCIDYETGL